MLGRFSPGLAAAVSGRADAADIARRLVRRHLFAVRLAAEGEWYRYHHLLQAFLQGRLREHDPERLRDRHRRAAAWWSGEGQPAEAVRHLLEAGDQKAAVDAIEPVAERLVLTSEGETLAGWLDAIPHALWQDRPPIVLAQVGLLLHRARHEAAFAEAEEAIERLIDAGDHARAATAIVRLQQTMITAGTSPRRRWGSGERYRDRIAVHAPMLPVVRILLATAYGYGCRFERRGTSSGRLFPWPVGSGWRSIAAMPPSPARSTLTSDRRATRRAAVPGGGDLRAGGDRPRGPSAFPDLRADAQHLSDARPGPIRGDARVPRGAGRIFAVSASRASCCAPTPGSPGLRWPASAAGRSWARSSRLSRGPGRGDLLRVSLPVPGRAPRRGPGGHGRGGGAHRDGAPGDA